MRFLFAFLLFSSCIRSEGSGATSLVKVGDAAPDFAVALCSSEGVRQTTLAAERGSSPFLLVLVDFGCPTCARELAAMQSLIDRLPAGAGCMVVARGASVADVNAYRAEHALAFPIGADPTRAIFARYATLTVPRNYVLAPSGLVRYRTENDYDAALADRLIEELSK